MNTKKLIEYHEARSNSKKLHGVPRGCPEIPRPRSSLEYQEEDFDEVNRQTDTHTHIHTSRSFYEHQEAILEYHTSTECQEAFMQYKEAFMDYKDGLWNRKRLFWNIKKLLCNTKKPLPYPGAFKEYQEALSNTMKLDGIPRRIPRTCPEIRRISLEYQEALTNKSCKFVPRFRLYKVTEG